MASVLVSVVIPAYNAASTLSSTLLWLGRQSLRDFEVIVVDDGSTDETLSVAEAAAVQDPRIHVLGKTNGGVSSARNTGLNAAAGHWILFLDADDWLDDSYLARMLAALSASPGSRVARCRHARVAPSGAQMEGPTNDPDHFFETLARQAMGATHAYLTETALVREVGGFDETLKICEDWDLWQRIARTGAPLVDVPEVLAYYRMQRGSLTSDGRRLLADARTVLGRGMSEDPRVPRPDPRWAFGAPTHQMEVALQPIAVWCATWALVDGRPWGPLLDEVEDWSQLADYQSLLYAFHEGFLLGHCVAAGEIAGLVDDMATAANDIFGDLARRTLRPDLATSWRRGLSQIFAHMNVDGFDARNVAVPADGLLPSVPGAVDGELLVLRLMIAGRARRLVEVVHWLPVDHADMARLLVGGAAQRVSAAVRRRVLNPLAPPGGPRSTDLTMRLRRRAVALIQRVGWHLEDVTRQPAPASIRSVEHQDEAPVTPFVEDARPSHPTAYWEQLFSQPDPWKYDSDYERVKYERSLAMLDGLEIDNALECACAEGHFTRELAGVVRHLRAVDISATAIGRAAERCADRSNVDFAQLDFFGEEIPGSWDLIVCSEVLYYTNDEALLADVARKLAAALAPGGVLLTAHAHLMADDPSKPGFDWDHPYGGQRILEVLAEAGELVPVKQLVTPLYSIALYRRRADGGEDQVTQVQQAPVGAELSPYVESGVLWRGAVRTRSEVAQDFGYDVPILMYHRITDHPTPALARWAVSPAAFERQVNFLRRRGFHTMSMQQLVDARRSGRPIPGRPVILTFDDAYLDFVERALPVLQRRGFGATVFVPTGHIGGAADWDGHAGPAAPLMDRAQLRELAKTGIELSSHLHSHTRVDHLSFSELMQEALDSRRILEEITGAPPSVMATPFGVLDAAALSILRTAGFQLVATTDHGTASLLHAGRVVPRLEVMDGSLAHLHGLLDHGSLEAPTEDELAVEADEGCGGATAADAGTLEVA